MKTIAILLILLSIISCASEKKQRTSSSQNNEEIYNLNRKFYKTIVKELKKLPKYEKYLESYLGTPQAYIVIAEAQSEENQSILKEPTTQLATQIALTGDIIPVVHPPITEFKEKNISNPSSRLLQSLYKKFQVDLLIVGHLNADNNSMQLTITKTRDRQKLLSQVFTTTD